MNKWLMRIGVFLIVIGILLFTPLADYLPIDLWQSIKSIFSSENTHTYFKVLPGEASYTPHIVFLSIGALFVASSLLIKRRGSK